MNFTLFRVFLFLNLIIGLTGITNTALGAAAAHENPSERAQKIDAVAVAAQAQPAYPLKLVLEPTPIMEAAKKNNVKLLKKALQAKPDSVNYQYAKDGYTALMYAASAENRSAVEMLLKHKADPAILGYSSNNALHIACRKSDGKQENTTLCENLIKHRADVNAYGEGFTPLMIAAINACPTITQLLLQHNANPSIVMIAPPANMAHCETPIDFALTCNTHSNERGQVIAHLRRALALQKIIKEEQQKIELAQPLNSRHSAFSDFIKTNIDTSDIDNPELDNYRLSQIQSYISQDAVNNNDGTTFLLFALQTPQHFSLETIRNIINTPNMLLDAKDRLGNTALSFAFSHDNAEELVTLLIEKGASVTMPIGPQNLSPLFAATQDKLLPIIELLLNAGAHTDIHTHLAKSAISSPFLLAIHNGFAEAVTLFLKYNLSEELLDLGIMIAREHKQELIVRILEQKKRSTQTPLIHTQTKKLTDNTPVPRQQNIISACATCHKSGTHGSCSRCHTVYYCSPSCQKAGWNTHKQNCIKKPEAASKHKQAEETPDAAAAQPPTPTLRYQKSRTTKSHNQQSQNPQDAASNTQSGESLVEKIQKERAQRLIKESSELMVALKAYQKALDSNTPESELRLLRFDLQKLEDTHKLHENDAQHDATLKALFLSFKKDRDNKSKRKKEKPIAAPQPTPAHNLSRRHRNQHEATPTTRAQRHAQAPISAAAESSDITGTQRRPHIQQQSRNPHSAKASQQTLPAIAEPFYDPTRVALIPLKQAFEEPRNAQVLLKPNLIPIRYGEDTFYLDKVHLFEGEDGNRGLHHDYKQQLRNSRFRKYAYEPIAIAGQANGCYSLEGNEGDERAYKSFFPSDWKPKTLEHNIDHALKNEIRFFYKSERNSTISHCFCGFMKRPIPIYFKGILDPDTLIVKSIFPITEEAYNAEQDISTALARSQEKTKQRRQQRQPKQSTNDQTHSSIPQNTTATRTPAPTGTRLNPLAKPWGPQQLLQESDPADSSSDKKEEDNETGLDPALECSMAASDADELARIAALSLLEFNQR